MGLKLWPLVRSVLLLLLLRADGAREGVGCELQGRGVEVVVKLVCQVSLVPVRDSARRREVERPFRKDWADWRDLASYFPPSFEVSRGISGGLGGGVGITLKISRPLFRRRAFTMLISGGCSFASSGVSMRSFSPYLCGLSSGRGEGAGIVGERADERWVGTSGGSSKSLSVSSTVA